jgi:hypothetical protein
VCFKNLPIEFDSHGRARLRADWNVPAPRSPRTDGAIEQLAAGAHLRDFDVDPVTRVAGS